MQRFICVACAVVLCTGQQRSLFRDVVASLSIRSQLRDESNHNDGNNLSQNYDRYGYEHEPPELPGDVDFIPRRNDRIEMPSVKYRYPKSIQVNGSEIKVENKKEDIIVYVNTPTDRSEAKSTTHKQRTDPKPSSKVNFVKHDEEMADGETDVIPDNNNNNNNKRPIINKMEGLSQIGNREYQTVIKPTVIVNFRGTVSHRDSDIRLEKRNHPTRKQELDSARNIFNINQEIKVERPHGTIDIEGKRHLPNEVTQSVAVVQAKVKECAVCEESATAAGGAGGVLRLVVTL